MKLQDAYAAETGAVGAWDKIGYIGPGTKSTTATKGESATTVFTYKDDFAKESTTLIGALGNDTDAWSATAKTALNDCAVNSVWTIKLSKGSTTADGSLVKYTAANPEGTGCSSLTANFENIGN